MAFELAGRVTPGGEVVGVDFSEGMLDLARAKAVAHAPSSGMNVQFKWGNALALEYPDDAFAAATVGFGARNFSDLERGLREMTRVVRPGGHVVVLEITTPTRPPLSTFFDLWFDRAVPAIGKLAGDSQAYSYLPNSVKRFPGPPALAALMARLRAELAAVRDHRGRDHRAARRRGSLVSAVEAVVAAGRRRGAQRHGPRRGADARSRHRTRRAARGYAGETISAGGKRLRPLLVCLSAGVPVPESDGLVRSAVAVELVHAATLVHDDVLDGSALRRGRPTVVAAGGRLIATATGDLLFSRAFSELVATRSVEAVRTLARASSGLASGELMQREDAWRPEVSLERYLERCRLKTAVLFRAACELGALEGDGPVSALGGLRRADRRRVPDPR